MKTLKRNFLESHPVRSYDTITKWVAFLYIYYFKSSIEAILGGKKHENL